jgi:hypothetical protein
VADAHARNVRDRVEAARRQHADVEADVARARARALGVGLLEGCHQEQEREGGVESEHVWKRVAAALVRVRNCI